MSQGALFGVTVPPGLKLGARQMLALERLAEKPLTSEEIGVAVHRHRSCSYCKPGEPCQYAASEGAEVASSLRRHGLTKFSRKRRVWYLVERGLPPERQSSQSDQIPY